MPTYYEILGVETDANTREIRRAYLTIIKRHHPDLHGQQADPLSRLANEAYQTLKDSHRRMRYDSGLINSHPGSAHSPTNQPTTPKPPTAPPPRPTTDRKPRSNAHQHTPRQERAVMFDCEWCYGRGRDWNDTPCIGCNGSGKQANPTVRFSGAIGTTTCQWCYGQGKNCLGVKCVECEGSGRQPIAPVGQRLCPDCQGYGTRKDKEKWKPRYQRPPCNSCHGTGLT